MALAEPPQTGANQQGGSGTVSEDMIRMEVVNAFHFMEYLHKTNSSSHGNNGTQHIRDILEDYEGRDDVFEPNIQLCMQLATKTQDVALVKEFILVIIATNDSADEGPPSLLCEFYRKNSDLCNKAFKTLPRDQQKTAFQIISSGIKTLMGARQEEKETLLRQLQAISQSP